MKKLVALILAALLALSLLTSALAATYTDKETVKAVQQALNDAGYNCGTPDGVAGKNTAAAISQYQTDNGLEVTGAVDDALLAALGLAEEEAPAEEAETEPEPAVETGEAGLAGPWPGYDDVPPLPADIAAVVPGIPMSLDELPEEVDLAKLDALCDWWRGEDDLIETLLNEGTYTFDSMGIEWVSEQGKTLGYIRYTDDKGYTKFEDLSVEVSDGMVTLTGNRSKLAGLTVNDVDSFMLYDANYQYDIYYYGYDGLKLAAMHFYYFNGYNNGDYDAEYLVIHPFEEYAYGIRVFEDDRSTGLTKSSWTACYDDEGKLVDLTYDGD